MIWAHAHEPPPRLAEVEHPLSAAALDEVIARAMAKTPAERFAGAGELADAVRAAAGPPTELPLLAQPLALIGELATEITTEPLGSGLTATERAPGTRTRSGEGPRRRGLAASASGAGGRTVGSPDPRRGAPGTPARHSGPG